MISDAPNTGNRRRPWWWRALLIIVACAALALAAILGWLKLNESELVFRTANSRHRTDGAIPLYAERIGIRAADGAALAALLLPADPTQDSGVWVLHLHGNADSAFSSLQLKHVEQLRDLGLNVLTFDYRGFGLSAGVASETHIEQDTESAWQELIHRGVPPHRIIVWGHSLGSGPAVQLAARHPVGALVLFGAYTSIPDAAQDTYSFLPVRWLTGVQFNSVGRIGEVHAPVLIAHSTADTIILFHHGKELFAAAHEPKRFFELAPPYRDEFGGHVNALYDHLDLIAPALEGLLNIKLAH